MYDFSENTSVETLDKVPEEFKGMYAEVKNDESGDVTGYQIGDTHKASVEAIMGLTKALATSRGEAKELKGKVDLTDLKKWGDTASAIKASFEGELKTISDQLLQGKEATHNFETLKTDLLKGHEVELATLATENDRVRGQLHHILVKKEAQAAILAEKGKNLLLPFVEEHVRVKDVDGDVKVFVVDKENNIRHSATTGQPMTITEFVKSMKTDPEFGILFESNNPQGGGGGGTPPRSTSTPQQNINAKPTNPNSKIAQALESRLNR